MAEKEKIAMPYITHKSFLPYAIDVDSRIPAKNQPFVKETRNIHTIWKEVELPDIDEQNSLRDRMERQVAIDKFRANVALASGNAHLFEAALNYYSELFREFALPTNDAPTPLDK